MDDIIYQLLKRLVEVKDIGISEDEIREKVNFFYDNEKITEENKTELLNMLPTPII